MAADVDDPDKSYYDILGVVITASPNEIKRAYRRLCRGGAHPDKGGSEDDFRRVNRAYEVLSDPKRREEYDEEQLDLVADFVAPFMLFTFCGQRHHELRTLAQHMASEWDEAGKVLASSKLNEFVDWLDNFALPPDLERVLDSCRKKQFHTDRLVAMIIVAMAPDLPPSFRGNSIDRKSLISLARAAAKDGVQERNIINRLRDSGALNGFADLPDCDGYAELDDQWQRNVAVIRNWSMTSSALQKVVSSQREGEVEAILLWALLDFVRSGELAAEAARADTDAARTRPWFRLFRDNRPVPPREDLLPAYCLAVTIVAPVAEREHADEVAKDRAANLTDRLRLLNEEQKKLQELERRLQAELDRVEKERQEAKRQAEQRRLRAEHARQQAEKHAEEERKRAEHLRREAAARAARYERLQRAARSLLDDLNGPVNRYHVALGIGREIAESPLDPALHLAPSLPPLPTEGAPSDQIVAMANVFPVAATHCETLAAQAKTVATRRLAAVDRRMRSVRDPAAPLPEFKARPPRRPGPNVHVQAFRKRSVATLATVVVFILAWVWGASSYSGGGEVLGDGLRALFGIATIITAGIILYVWVSSIGKARTGRQQEIAATARYEADQRNYQAQVRERRRQEQAAADVERERLTKLAEATALRERERSVADELKGLANRSRLAAFDLEEIVRSDQFQWIVHEATQLIV